MTILDGDKENPLLDSRFPDVSGKGRGYQIQALKNGLPEWPELRKISVWQTVSALEEVRAIPYLQLRLFLHFVVFLLSSALLRLHDTPIETTSIKFTSFVISLVGVI